MLVQGLNPLTDGRASPAQLTGLIQRGDVLLSIDERSLVNMPIDMLISGLSPLSSPQANGAYKRFLKLRFASGEGLSLLEKDEKIALKNSGSEIFSLARFMPASIPMVDQLSGQPLFADAVSDAPESLKRLESTIDLPQSVVGIPGEADSNRTSCLSLDTRISRGLADRHQNDLEKYISGFYAWNNDFSDLLKPTVKLLVYAEEVVDQNYQSKSQIFENSLQVMKGAKALSYCMEDIDKGTDLRSFKAWSSTLSLRSRASTRRRFVFDTTAMAGSAISEGNSDIGSMGSSASGDFDGLNPDELLIQLAAQDEIWRKQVIKTLKESTQNMVEEEEKKEENDGDLSETPAITEMDLGSLFLGEKVNQLLTKRKKSFALPPEEVTTVLFDLVTNLASTTPDEISVKGGFNINPQTSLVPFEKQKSYDENHSLAIRFVIDDVFPAWLNSFKALPWEERRVLWVHTRASAMESHTGASFAHSLDDALTLDSGSTGYPSPSVRKRKKDLRETIEDMELDTESRGETYVYRIQSLSPLHATLTHFGGQLLSANFFLYSSNASETDWICRSDGSQLRG